MTSKTMMKTYPPLPKRAALPSQSVWVLFGALLWLLPIPTNATIVQALSAQDMVGRAHLIIEGSVTQQRVKKLGKHGPLVTDNVILIKRLLKGKLATKEIVVRSMGGQYNGLVEKVSGASRFSKGEKVLLYLTPAQPTKQDPYPFHYLVVNMAYGKYTIFSHPQKGTWMLARQTDLPVKYHLKKPSHHASLHVAPYCAGAQLLSAKRREISKLLKQHKRHPKSQRVSKPALKTKRGATR